MRGTDEHPGIIQLAINDIFDHIKVYCLFIIKITIIDFFNTISI